MAASTAKLFRVAIYWSFILAVLAVPRTRRGSPSTDPDVIQYLTEVFNGVKGSGRKPVNEELNLLPDENEGFANMVRCFSADRQEYRLDDSVTTKEQTNKIVLSFHLHALENTDKIVAVKVVFKHLASLPQFRATVYEMKENGHLVKLDSQLSDNGWVDLKVQEIFEFHKQDKTTSKSVDFDKQLLDKEHRIVIELTELDSVSLSEAVAAALHSINPFIAVYTYDKKVYEHLSGSAGRLPRTASHLARTISKRQATTASMTESRPFADLAKDDCQLHGVNITVQELGYLDPIYDVELPNWLNFTFCYGRCDQPLEVRNRNKYTTPAKMLSLLKPDLAKAGLAPCCAPKFNETTSIQIILSIGNVTETTTLPLVKSCQCQ